MPMLSSVPNRNRMLFPAIVVPAIAVFILSACSKVPPAEPQLHDVVQVLPTAGMGTARVWNGKFQRRYSLTSPQWDTVSIHPDTSFALSIPAPDSVAIFGNTYGYDTTDSIQGIRYFGTVRQFFTTHTGTGVAYFYLRDSMVIIRSGFIWHNYEEVDYWQTPRIP